MFGTPPKLHSSQTALTQVCSVFIFWSPLKLHSSQTQGWVCQSVCEALCQSIHFPLHIPHKRERNRLTPIELFQTGFNIMGIANFYIIRERRIRQNINDPPTFPICSLHLLLNYTALKLTRRVATGGSCFETPLKLHSSQTRKATICTFIMFGTPLKLHSSQTMALSHKLSIP